MPNNIFPLSSRNEFSVILSKRINSRSAIRKKTKTKTTTEGKSNVSVLQPNLCMTHNYNKTFYQKKSFFHETHLFKLLLETYFLFFFLLMYIWCLELGPCFCRPNISKKKRKSYRNTQRIHTCGKRKNCKAVISFLYFVSCKKLTIRNKYIKTSEKHKFLSFCTHTLYYMWWQNGHNLMSTTLRVMAIWTK